MTDAGAVIVFDLDDTLYLERDYVRSGFRAVADEIAIAFPALRDQAFDLLWEDFVRGLRGSNFDRLAALLPCVAAAVPVDRMVDVYRSHAPEIAPLAGAEPLLQTLKTMQMRCGLITDGRRQQQLGKLQALGLERFFDHVIVNETADRFKPDGRSFRQMQHELGADGGRCWYIGDNLAKDFAGPSALGWKSIRLTTPGQIRTQPPPAGPAADYTVTGLHAVLKFVPAAADNTIA